MIGTRIIDFFLPQVEADKFNEVAVDYDSRRMTVFLFIIALVLGSAFALINLLLGIHIYMALDAGLTAIAFLFLTLSRYQRAPQNKALNCKNAIFIFSLLTGFVIAAKHSISPETMSANLLWAPLLTLITVLILHGVRMYLATFFIIAFFIAAEFIKSNSQSDLISVSSLFISLFNYASILATSLAALFLVRQVTAETNSTKEALISQVETTLSEKEEKSILLSIVGHDLSNSIAVIDGISHHLLRTENSSDPGKQGMLLKILDHSKRVGRLLKQVRNFQSVNEGKIVVQTRPTDITDCLEEAVVLTQDLFDEKNISIVWERPLNNESLLVVADQTILTNNIFCNLLTNAAKFSKKNSKIDISIIDDVDKVTVKVKDYGMGIPKALVPHLFSKKLPTSRLGTAGEKGTGLGLPIAKMFLDKFEADIKIRTVQESLDPDNCGTEFTILFKKAELLEILQDSDYLEQESQSKTAKKERHLKLVS